MTRTASVIAICVTLSSPTFGQNINASLCQLGPKAGNVEILSSRPTTDLENYLAGLKTGKVSFAWTINWHEAAIQLGLNNRFATAYGQVEEEAKVRIALRGIITIGEIVDYISTIISEEKAIDALTSQRERHFEAIVYLRAMQSWECAFPSVFQDTPTAQAVLDQLNHAYPDLKLERSNTVFAEVYDKTVKRARDRVAQAGSVSIFRIIEDWRDEILK